MTTSNHPARDAKRDQMVRLAVALVEDSEATAPVSVSSPLSEAELQPLMPSNAPLASFGTEYLKQFQTAVKQEFDDTQDTLLWQLYEDIDSILMMRLSSR